MNNWSSDCFCIMKRDFERSSPWIECDALWHIFFLLSTACDGEIFDSFEYYNNRKGNFLSQKKIISSLALTSPYSLFPCLPNSLLFYLPRPQCLCHLNRLLPHVLCPLPSLLSPNPPSLEASMSTQHLSSQCKRYAFYWVHLNGVTVSMFGLDAFCRKRQLSYLHKS